MKILSIKSNFANKMQKHKKINIADINSIKTAKQVFSDCYLLSSMHALTQSKFGRTLLYKNIKKSTYNFSSAPAKLVKNANNSKELNTYSIKFNDVYGKKETYTITPEDYSKNYTIFSKQKNPLICSMEIAMSKLVNNHFFKKPIISRMYLPFLYRNFEFNIPSNFLKTFTGIKPYTLGEKSINLSLKPYRKETLEIFKKMSDNPDKYSFIAGTGLNIFKKRNGWHCYTVLDCNEKMQKITLQNKRMPEPMTLTFDEAIKKLKFLVGYFDPKIKS